jgi:hypothetical protein
MFLVGDEDRPLPIWKRNPARNFYFFISNLLNELEKIYDQTHVSRERFNARLVIVMGQKHTTPYVIHYATKRTPLGKCGVLLEVVLNVKTSLVLANQPNADPAITLRDRTRPTMRKRNGKAVANQFGKLLEFTRIDSVVTKGTVLHFLGLRLILRHLLKEYSLDLGSSHFRDQTFTRSGLLRICREPLEGGKCFGQLFQTDANCSLFLRKVHADHQLKSFTNCDDLGCSNANEQWSLMDEDQRKVWKAAVKVFKQPYVSRIFHRTEGDVARWTERGLVRAVIFNSSPATRTLSDQILHNDGEYLERKYSNMIRCGNMSGTMFLLLHDLRDRYVEYENMKTTQQFTKKIELINFARGMDNRDVRNENLILESNLRHVWHGLKEDWNPLPWTDMIERIP